MKEFIQKKFYKENFSEKNFSETIFNECIFEGCEFNHTNLTKAKFISCKVLRSHWSTPVLLQTRLHGVEFIESKLMGIDFTLCDTAFFGIYFIQCLLDSCNFTELKLKKGRFTECKVRQCFFTQCDLEEADFLSSDLTGSIFHHTNLTKANFTDATHFTIDPRNNILKRAKFPKLEALALLEALDIQLI